MSKTFLTVAVLIILFEGIGTFVLKMLKVDARGFTAPVGAAIFLGMLQLLYYPAQLANLSYMWIIVVTSILLIGGLAMTLLSIRDVWKGLYKPDTLIVFACLAVFLYAFSKCYINLEFSDTQMYLNYICQSINIDHLNRFNLANGLTGAEWDINYLFQGYYHFVSYLCWLVNLPHNLFHQPVSASVSNLVFIVWGMGSLYNILSSMLIINIVRYFNYKDHWFENALLFFSLFFTNFFYWKVAFSFYGNTYRGFFATLLLYIIFRWLKEKNEPIKYLIPFIAGAGMACSSSYMFICFEILYILAAYLFVIRKSDSLFDMMILIIPLVLFVIAFVSRSYPAISWILFIVYTSICTFHNQKKVRQAIDLLEGYFFKYAIQIFYISVPCIYAAGSLVLDLWKHEPLFVYSRYFQDFRLIDMVKDYLFIHSGWLDNVLNVLRWSGAILLVRKAKSTEDRFIRNVVILMVVFFLDPLCMIMLEKTITGIVFYRSFEILFNPLTEALFFTYIYDAIDKTNTGKLAMEILLIGSVIIGQVTSYAGKDESLFGFYVRYGREVDPIYKMESDERYANEFLAGYVEEHPQSTQVTLISQSNATKTYLTSAYQIFGMRDYYYEIFRLDENFYQITKRHHEWLTPVDTDYSVTCTDLHKYKVDYILLQYWENPEFDEASNGCSVTIYTGSKYKVKKVDGE